MKYSIAKQTSSRQKAWQGVIVPPKGKNKSPAEEKKWKTNVINWRKTTSLEHRHRHKQADKENTKQKPEENQSLWTKRSTYMAAKKTLEFRKTFDLTSPRGPKKERAEERTWDFCFAREKKERKREKKRRIEIVIGCKFGVVDCCRKKRLLLQQRTHSTSADGLPKRTKDYIVLATISFWKQKQTKQEREK